jgi:hypothetical protein
MSHPSATPFTPGLFFEFSGYWAVVITSGMAQTLSLGFAVT